MDKDFNVQHSMYSEERLSEEKLLGEEHPDDAKIHILRSNTHWNCHVYLWGFQLFFFLMSLTILSRALFHQAPLRPCNCEDHMPMWSPALEAVRGTGHTQRFDGSFSTPNAFKGPPSPDIDGAWDSITYANGMYFPDSRVGSVSLIAIGGVINISEETLQAVNASAAYSVKLAPEIGGGYMASVEALHQLHCLNILRQATYEDYYKDKAEPWQDSPQTLRYHLGAFCEVLS